MAPFSFNSETHFVASSDGTTLQVYELTSDPTIHPSSIRKIDWKELATIYPGPEGVVVVAAKDEEEDVLSLYDGLLFVDNRGRIEGRHALTMLAQDLAQLGFLVSPEGYCFHDVTEHEMFVEMEIFYLRLNDRFSWSNHGVVSVTTMSSTIWSNRFELKHFHRDLPEGGEKLMMSQPRRTHYVTVRRNEYEELKRTVKEQDKDLEMMSEELDETKEENKELREKNKELRKTLREKDRATRDLVDKHDDELDKLKEEKDDAIVAKDKLQREKDEEGKKKDEEIQRLKEDIVKGKNEEGKKKDEEIQRLKEDIVKRKDEELELQKKLAKKDDEIRRVEKEKSDEEVKTRKVEGELKEAREKLSSGLAEAKKELEHCQKNSWAILPSTKFLPQSLDAKDKYLTTRQPFPPGIFRLREQVGSDFVSNTHKVVDKMVLISGIGVKFVDEESSSITTTEWPLLQFLTVYVGKGTTKDFDVNHWWYLKTTHPEGGLTMLVYYEGNYSQISQHDPRKPAISLPYSKDAEVNSFYSRFSFFDLYPFGLRFGFAYRPLA